MNKLVTLGLLAVLIPATHITHLFLNNIYKNNSTKTETVFNLPSPEIMQIASLGYDNFLADILWLELIQYIGDTYDFKIHPEVYSLVNTITTLDPKFKDAYIYGSYALVDNKEFDKAINILDKGIMNNPDEWYFPYQEGFLYYIYKKNKVAAARYLNKASEVKDAPPLAKRLAALMYSQAVPEIDIKINLWNQVFEKAKKDGDKYNMEKAYKKLVEFKIEKDLGVIKDAIRKYNDKYEKQKSETVLPDNTVSKQPQLTADVTTPKPLKELKALVDEGYLKEIPLDPFDRPYIFDERTQDVSAFPLPLDSGKDTQK